jgi:hypothetical protein
MSATNQDVSRMSIFFGNSEVTYHPDRHDEILLAHAKWIEFGSKFAEVSDNNRKNGYGVDKVWYETPSGFLRFYPSELYTGDAKNDRAWPIIGLIGQFLV